GGAGVLCAASTRVSGAPSRVDAAVAIDRVFHLNERLSTALTLPDDLRVTPAGRALLAAAIKHVSSLDIGSGFAPAMPRRAWVPLIPAALAVGLLTVPAFIETRAQARVSETID